MAKPLLQKIIVDTERIEDLKTGIVYKLQTVYLNEKKISEAIIKEDESFRVEIDLLDNKIYDIKGTHVQPYEPKFCLYDFRAEESKT